jgi:protoporphyrinogen IX oxidase
MQELLWLRFAHFSGWMLWVAGLTGMALALLAGAASKPAGRLADAGATIAMASGIYMAVTQAMFKQGWLHVKLLLVVALIALHGILRARTGKNVTRGISGLLAATVVVGVLIVAAAVIRPLGR